ncbi:STAS domain-containing protein [uncultured Methylovirgula sp.]|uniref:STAS domain-containing protein n=1 Tax=uncultured Methylovirgula sp. TaxID=1285960 RepID=UPI0026214081|nr:STAS domain-containing protein [uncultured Methylovirgula sp.]
MAEREDHDGVTTLTLEPVLDLKATTPLAEQLLAHRGADIIVDASAVERLGAQSLQVLLSALATWQADGHQLQFKQPSEAFIESLQLFGVDAEPFMKHPHLAG